VGVSVALLIQHAKRMRRDILSHLWPVTLQNISTLPHKRKDFKKRVTKHKMGVFILSTPFV
jgi:hypothetical protein